MESLIRYALLVVIGAFGWLLFEYAAATSKLDAEAAAARGQSHPEHAARQNDGQWITRLLGGIGLVAVLLGAYALMAWGWVWLSHRWGWLPGLWPAVTATLGGVIFGVILSRWRKRPGRYG